jgi:hypothetical protein
MSELPTLTGLKHTLKSLEDVDISSFVPNYVLKVNNAGTKIEEVSASSIILPAVGSGNTDVIPTFTGSIPPIFQPTAMSVTTTLPIPLSGQAMDLDNANPSKDMLMSADFLGDHLVALSTNSDGASGGDADLYAVNLSTTNKDVIMGNAATGGVILLDSEIVATSSDYLSLEVSASTGNTGDILTADGTGFCSWQPTTTFATVNASDIPIRNPAAGETFIDSGVSITHPFPTLNIIQPNTITDPIRLISSSSVGIGSNTTSTVLIDADTATGSINLQSASSQIINYNTASISANNGVTVNGAGGQSVVISPTGIEITTQTGCSLKFIVNGMQFTFQVGSTGGYFWPLTDGAAGQSLKTNGAGVLYWG